MYFIQTVIKMDTCSLPHTPETHQKHKSRSTHALPTKLIKPGFAYVAPVCRFVFRLCFARVSHLFRLCFVYDTLMCRLCSACVSLTRLLYFAGVPLRCRWCFACDSRLIRLCVARALLVVRL